MSGYTPKEDGYIERRRRAMKLLEELRADSRKMDSEHDADREEWNKHLLEGLSSVPPTLGTSSREDPLTGLATSLMRRESEVRTTMASIYTRTHQELGFPHTTEELVDGMVEKLNLLPSYPHELSFERQKVGEAFMRFKDKKRFLDWYRSEYLE